MSIKTKHFPPNEDTEMFTIKVIGFRKILNSHVDFTNEYIIELVDGPVGVAGSSQGETISIYEDKKISINPKTIIKKLEEDGYIGRSLDQKIFDEYLEQHFSLFGRNNTYSISLAFLRATEATGPLCGRFNKPQVELSPPRICCNILNGGWHAYTNPVLSDFPEYILVARSNDIQDVINKHNEIQRVVKEKLLKQKKVVVAGNLVNRFATDDNRECIDFLLDVQNGAGLSNDFDLMIDASATDLRSDDKYVFPITDNSFRTSEELYEYWMDIIRQYKIGFLEDPFSEKDTEAWHKLTTSQTACNIIGDNFYSSHAGRIAQGAENKYTHGVVIKPNQSGTVTSVRNAIETAQRKRQIIITSHRSISTEETFISALTCTYGVPYIKIGPLITDYSSVIRLNEIIRVTEQ